MTASRAWLPPSDLAQDSNIARFANRLGLANAGELVQKSIDDIAWFWDAVVKDLGIEFFEPYQQVLDTSRGIPWTRWFVGGTLNVAYNCLDRHASSSRSEKVAILWEGEDGAVRSFTYRELHADTNRLANALRRLGVAKGDRVAVMLPMIPEAVMSLLAIAKIGAIALPIFSGFGSSAVADRLTDAEAKLLITSDGFLRKGRRIALKEVADEAVSLAPSVETVLVVRRLNCDVPWHPSRDVWFDVAIATESPECASEPMDSEAPFLIVYTSGTTGRPKGAVHVHGGFLVKIAQEVAHQGDLRDDDRLYWFTDMGWIMGPWEVIGGLALGGSLFLYEGSPDFPDVDRLWSQVERHRVTILGLSPTLIRSLMKHGEGPVAKHDLSSLRILGSTGEPWNPDPWRWYLDNVGGGRCPVVNFSGGTEVGACLLSVRPGELIKPCSLGGPSLGMAMDVVDSEGRSIRGEVGELVCRKPWPGMTRGLWRDPERYLSTYWSRWPDVWVHGDWASVDEDGEWFLHGRSDDTIKIAGKRIGPAEIESVLVGHPLVTEAAAIGVPDMVKGEVIWAFVVVRLGVPGDDVLIAQLRTLVAESLGKSFAPETIRFVAELPRTRSAKILRRAIRAAAVGGDAGDLSSLENPAALEAIRDVVPAQE
ncbi:MAG: acyl-CoA synthetase/AMP-acid ligase [Planctomycetota bacterium]|nr:acyl-CoA synthetase/AMP-acid ligase [Planctomycetota bacterium]